MHPDFGANNHAKQNLATPGGQGWLMRRLSAGRPGGALPSRKELLLEQVREDLSKIGTNLRQLQDMRRQSGALTSLYAREDMSEPANPRLSLAISAQQSYPGEQDKVFLCLTMDISWKGESKGYAVSCVRWNGISSASCEKTTAAVLPAVLPDAIARVLMDNMHLDQTQRRFLTLSLGVLGERNPPSNLH